MKFKEVKEQFKEYFKQDTESSLFMANGYFMPKKYFQVCKDSAAFNFQVIEETAFSDVYDEYDFCLAFGDCGSVHEQIDSFYIACCGGYLLRGDDILNEGSHFCYSKYFDNEYCIIKIRNENNKKFIENVTVLSLYDELNIQTHNNKCPVRYMSYFGHDFRYDRNVVIELNKVLQLEGYEYKLVYKRFYMTDLIWDHITSVCPDVIKYLKIHDNSNIMRESDIAGMSPINKKD